jgi:hypothetical protein
MELAAIKVNCQLVSTDHQVIGAIRAFLKRLPFLLWEKDVAPTIDENIAIRLPDWNRQVVARPLELSTLRGRPDKLYCQLAFTPPVVLRDRSYAHGFCRLFRQSQPNSPWELSEYFVLATDPRFFLQLTSGERDCMLKI